MDESDNNEEGSFSEKPKPDSNPQNEKKAS